MKPPAFQFYPDDFTAGVSTMTQTEVGAYILLLCHQWSVGKISSEAERMEIVAKGKVSDHVLSKFPNGKNKRLEIERKKQQLFRESRAKNGKLGGRPCKASDNLVVLKTEPRKSSPSPSPSVDTITHTHAAEIPSLTEIKDFASGNGVKPESAQSFFDHHEGNQLWINQHGKAINWRHKIVSWAAKDRATPPASARTEPTKGPKLSEVVAYAKDKFGDDSRHLNWSASFHRYWADPKRNWKRADKTIDWQIEFSKQAANWRTQP